ncbi:unnamed protein product [Owenia fusiformis]|uniref:Uncharacterized protein n=1 Tax=Owenia fusiformis TaxID=6347 RepID=A0A8J1TI89_OWEFU|nr:unnamed protein product [Owenia fusiformis]
MPSLTIVASICIACVGLFTDATSFTDFTHAGYVWRRATKSCILGYNDKKYADYDLDDCLNMCIQEGVPSCRSIEYANSTRDCTRSRESSSSQSVKQCALVDFFERTSVTVSTETPSSVSSPLISTRSPVTPVTTPVSSAPNHLWCCNFESSSWDDSNDGSGCGRGYRGMNQLITDDFDFIRLSGNTPSGHTGPEMSDGGFYVYAESSPPRTRREKATIRTPDLDGDAHKVIRFKYHTRGQLLGTLNVDAFNANSFIGPAFGQLSMTSSDQWKSVTMALPNGTTAVEVTVTLPDDDKFWSSDIAIDDVCIDELDDQITTPPVNSGVVWACDFERAGWDNPLDRSGCGHNFAGMTQSISDSFNFTRRNIATPSVHTGPSSGSDFGYFIFTESSPTSSQPDRRGMFASVRTARLQDTLQQYLTFKYHTKGYVLGNIVVEAINGNTQRITALQIGLNMMSMDAWKSASIELPNGTAYVDFTVTLPDDERFWSSDIALDEIVITSIDSTHSTLPTPETTTDTPSSTLSTLPTPETTTDTPSSTLSTLPTPETRTNTSGFTPFVTTMPTTEATTNSAQRFVNFTYGLTWQMAQQSCIPFRYERSYYGVRLTIYECLHRCLLEESFPCRSVEYIRSLGRCFLRSSSNTTVLVNCTADYYMRHIDNHYHCDFENGMCGMKNTSNATFPIGDFAWTLNSGDTPSKLTGPVSDHTYRCGSYMYIEASTPRKNGDIARMQSPQLRITDDACLTLFYHMYGKHMGSLSVIIQREQEQEVVWMSSGDKGDKWLRADIPLRTGSYYMIIEGTVGDGYSGDAAIDDVTIAPGPCNASFPVNIARTPHISKPTRKRTFKQNKPTVLLSCNFEMHDCGFTSGGLNSYYIWTRARATAFSDHTLSNSYGHYLGVRTSSSWSRRYTYAVSPKIRTTTPHCIMFYYKSTYVYSYETIYVDRNETSNGTVSTIWSSRPVTSWRRAILTNIQPGEYQIRFRFATDNSRFIAIDDLIVSSNCTDLNGEDMLEDDPLFRCTFEEDDYMSKCSKMTNDMISPLKWIVESGRSSDNYWGPTSDNTFKNCRGVFASSPASGSARYYLPTMTGTVGLRFAYRIHHSVSLRGLRVYIKEKSTSEFLWNPILYTNNTWQYAFIKSPTGAENVTFAIETSGATLGSVAIDDIELGTRGCDFDGMRCFNTSKCIPLYNICDGVYDCPEKDDEKNCDCSSVQFECNDGACIDKRKVCDCKPDCSTAEDENNCLPLMANRSHSFAANMNNQEVIFMCNFELSPCGFESSDEYGSWKFAGWDMNGRIGFAWTRTSNSTIGLLFSPMFNATSQHCAIFHLNFGLQYESYLTTVLVYRKESDAQAVRIHSEDIMIFDNRRSTDIRSIIVTGIDPGSYSLNIQVKLHKSIRSSNLITLVDFTLLKDCNQDLKHAQRTNKSLNVFNCKFENDPDCALLKDGNMQYEWSLMSTENVTIDSLPLRDTTMQQCQAPGHYIFGGSKTFLSIDKLYILALPIFSGSKALYLVFNYYASSTSRTSVLRKMNGKIYVMWHAKDVQVEGGLEPRWRQAEILLSSTPYPFTLTIETLGLVAIDDISVSQMEDCLSNEYQCRNSNICIPLLNKCNQINDCPERDDEDDCICHIIRQFECLDQDGRRLCLNPADKVCNCIDDCMNGEDEMNCTKVNEFPMESTKMKVFEKDQIVYYMCNFEDGPCNFTNGNSLSRWNWTFSKSQGASMQITHSLNGIDSSYDNPYYLGKERLKTPNITINSEHCLVFDLMTWGSNTTKFSIYRGNDSIEESILQLSGITHEKVWQRHVVHDLQAGTFNLVFAGEVDKNLTEQGYGLDNVMLLGHCNDVIIPKEDTPLINCTFEGSSDCALLEDDPKAYLEWSRKSRNDNMGISLPNRDATFANCEGHFLFINTIYLTYRKAYPARLLIPNINGSVDLSFKYYILSIGLFIYRALSSREMGLRVYQNIGGKQLWTTNLANTSNTWYHANVPMTGSKPYTIVIETLATPYDHVAIDDVIVQKRECRFYEERCPGSTICISFNKICDREIDCPGATDEMGCLCRADEFVCDNGRCVSPSSVCDCVDDCNNAEDEANCGNDLLSAATNSTVQPIFVCNFETSDCNMTHPTQSPWQWMEASRIYKKDHTTNFKSGRVMQIYQGNGERNRLLTPVLSTQSEYCLKVSVLRWSSSSPYGVLRILRLDLTTHQETNITANITLSSYRWRTYSSSTITPGTFRVVFEITGKGVILDDIIIVPCGRVDNERMIYKCSFENRTEESCSDSLMMGNGYKSPWSITNRKLSSSANAPAVDATLGTCMGHYAYFETNGSDLSQSTTNSVFNISLPTTTTSNGVVQLKIMVIMDRYDVDMYSGQLKVWEFFAGTRLNSYSRRQTTLSRYVRISPETTNVWLTETIDLRSIGYYYAIDYFGINIKSMVSYQAIAVAVDDIYLIRSGGCTPYEHPCTNSSKCIPLYKRCDSFKDCPFMDDENNCPCRYDERSCGDGICVHISSICDGVVDCKDGTDEQNCSTCRDDQFKCRHYQCVSNTTRCDGHEDCNDGSDEQNCVRFAHPEQENGPRRVELYSSGQWIPFCYNNWRPEFSDFLCKKIGFGLHNRTASMLSNFSKYAHMINSSLTPQVTSSCYNNQSVYLTCFVSSCGLRPENSPVIPLIIGGRMSELGRWPWFGAISSRSEGHVCGAALIDEWWAITAAHCVTSQSTSNTKLIFGTNRKVTYPWRKTSENEQFVDVRRFIIDPGYSRYYTLNDLALIQFRTPVKITEFVNPICLPEQNEDFQSNRSLECHTAGFGRVIPEDSSSLPDHLVETKTVIWTREACRRRYSDRSHTRDILCTGFASGFGNTCFGDSGSPLACRSDNNLWSLAGVTSFHKGGLSCAEKSSPHAIASVSRAVNWIKTTLNRYQPVPTSSPRPQTPVSTWCCDFERLGWDNPRDNDGCGNGFRGMTQLKTDDFDFTRIRGATPSSDTGPSAGLNGGFYIYTEASSPRSILDTASIRTPLLIGSVEKTMTFHYHTRGSDLGVLSVNAYAYDTLIGPATRINMTSSSLWKVATATLPTGTTSVEFSVTLTNSGFESDIAIDSLCISAIVSETTTAEVRESRVTEVRETTAAEVSERITTPIPMPITTIPASVLSDNENTRGLKGEWVGWFVCGLSNYSLILNISKQGLISGTVEFNGPGNAGAHYIRGVGISFFMFTPEDWLPGRVGSSKISGHGSLSDDKNTISGLIDSFCTDPLRTFKAMRNLDTDITPTTQTPENYETTSRPNTTDHYQYGTSNLQTARISSTSQRYTAHETTVDSTLPSRSTARPSTTGYRFTTTTTTSITTTTTRTPTTTTPYMSRTHYVTTDATSTTAALGSNVIFQCTFEQSICNGSHDDSADFKWTRNFGRTPSRFTGPNGDHSYNGLGHYLYIETSRPRKMGDIARIKFDMEEHYSSRILWFWYNMFGSAIDELNVRLDNTTIWQIAGQQAASRYGSLWKRSEYISIPTGRHELVFEGKRGASYRGDIAIDDIQVIGLDNTTSITTAFPTTTFHTTALPTSRGGDSTSNITTTLPTTASNSIPPTSDMGFRCTFDEGMCGITHDENADFQWTRHNGSTPTAYTGPSSDYNGNRGYYMYIETSRPRLAGDVARMIIPNVTSPSGISQLSFALSMNGSDIGKLVIKKTDGTRLAQYISRYRTWRRVHLALSGNVSALVFEGIRGQGYRGDIAIDNLEIVPLLPTTAQPTTTSAPRCGGSGHFSQQSGYISSPNYPGLYLNRAFCTYSVTAPRGPLTIVFMAFNVESTSGCTYDSLMIYDGTSALFGRIGTLCGVKLPGPFTTTGRSFYMTFSTDGSITKSGWSLRYYLKTRTLPLPIPEPIP